MDRLYRSLVANQTLLFRLRRHRLSFVAVTGRQPKFAGVAERFRIGYEFIEALKELRVNHDFV